MQRRRRCQADDGHGRKTHHAALSPSSTFYVAPMINDYQTPSRGGERHVWPRHRPEAASSRPLKVAVALRRPVRQLIRHLLFSNARSICAVEIFTYLSRHIHHQQVRDSLCRLSSKPYWPLDVFVCFIAASTFKRNVNARIAAFVTASSPPSTGAALAATPP